MKKIITKEYIQKARPFVLVACEESQRVTFQFRKLGFNAFSCDIIETSGKHPEWHIQEDVVKVIKSTEKLWDLLIAFPPCTDLCRSGARHFPEKIADGRQQRAINFFMFLAKCKIPRKAIENPIGIMSTKWRKPNQIIQPWQFGHPESKATCLWLENLPELKPTNVLDLPDCGYWNNQTPSRQNKLGPSKDRAKLRSKTYKGIARQMARQWSPLL